MGQEKEIKEVAQLEKQRRRRGEEQHVAMALLDTTNEEGADNRHASAETDQIDSGYCL